jgi:predicted ATPase
MFLSGLAEALGAAGRIDDGITAIDEALERATRNEELWFLPEALRIKGELNLLKCAPKFAGVSGRQGALSWELRTATSLARLRRDEGRIQEAHQLLAPIYDRFTEGFDTADLIGAKALLDTL